jgi:predicted Zn-dependent protease
MLDEIISALKARSDLEAWSVQHIKTRGAQLYAVPAAVEARRSVDTERYNIEIIRQTGVKDGSATIGASNTTLVPGDDIHQALDTAALMAGLIHNPPYTLPKPAIIPDVPLTDSTLQADPDAALEDLFSRIKASGAQFTDVQMPAVECFGEENTIRLINSSGIDATQTLTHLDFEFVLISHQSERDVETFTNFTQRRIADMDIEAEIARRIQHTRDLLTATTAPNYQGAVTMRGRTLEEFLIAGVIHNLSSGASKFSKGTPWEIGKTVFRGDCTGDPLNVWANRQLAYGTHSNRFDEEGIPAQRVALIQDSKLVTFTASQRYADYLNIPATGAFGNLELAAGSTSADDLIAEPHIEVVSFSWFNPDPVTGDFASEIRLGYVVNGSQRIPFRGGMLVGNVLDALADVRWSAETAFYGSYQGPTTARFANLTVAG